ncbi:MAG: hypothetical protein ACOX0E_09440 [Syntrophomonadaceae bacterium]|jgi:GTP1/Obg family GTP-binding protein
MTDREILELLLKNQTTMQESITQVNTRLDNLETKISKIDASQARMENEFTEKIRALYDAREVQNDVNERIISTLGRIEAKIDVLQLETAHLRRVK